MTVGPRIGTLNEAPLHADLKSWYARDDDRLEARVNGYVIDILRPSPDDPAEDLLIEVQTQRLTSIRRKLDRLLADHAVRVVSPVPAEKWLLKRPRRKGRDPECRKSPKRGTFLDVFREWVSVAPLIGHPNLSLEVLLIHEEEVRRFGGRRGRRRRGWATEERRLLRVVDQYCVDTLTSLRDLLPVDLPNPFDTADLATALDVPRLLAQKVAYVMRECGAIRVLRRRRSGIVYAIPADAAPDGNRVRPL